MLTPTSGRLYQGTFLFPNKAEKKQAFTGSRPDLQRSKVITSTGATQMTTRVKTFFVEDLYRRTMPTIQPSSM